MTVHKIVATHRAADSIPGGRAIPVRVEGRFDLSLLGRVERHPVGVPEFDPVVRRGIVGGRHDDPARVVGGAAGKSGRRDDPGVHGVGPRG